MAFTTASTEKMSSQASGTNGRSQAPFVLYSGLTVLFGLLNALTGPVVPEFERQAAVDSAGMGVVFMYRGIGSMAGGFGVGFILDAVSDPHCVLVWILIVKAAIEFTMPFGSSLALLSCQFGVVAFCANAISTVGSTSIAWTYGKQMGFQSNVMNAVFGVGACGAPALAAIFRYIDSRGVFAYWAIACLDLLSISAALIIPATKNPRLSANPGYKELPGGGQENQKKDELKADWLEVALCGTSVMFANAIEATIAFWLYTYSIVQLQLTAEAAGTVNTAFFVTFTATRFFCAQLSTSIGAASILKGSLAVAIVSSLGLIFPHGGALLPCLSMIGVGSGVAPFAGNAPVVLRQKGFITGRASSVTRMMSALGALMGCSGTGFLQKWAVVGPAAVPIVVCTGLVAETVVTLAFIRGH